MKLAAVLLLSLLSLSCAYDMWELESYLVGKWVGVVDHNVKVEFFFWKGPLDADNIHFSCHVKYSERSCFESFGNYDYESPKKLFIMDDNTRGSIKFPTISDDYRTYQPITSLNYSKTVSDTHKHARTKLSFNVGNLSFRLWKTPRYDITNPPIMCDNYCDSTSFCNFTSGQCFSNSDNQYYYIPKNSTVVPSVLTPANYTVYPDIEYTGEESESGSFSFFYFVFFLIVAVMCVGMCCCCRRRQAMKNATVKSNQPIPAPVCQPPTQPSYVPMYYIPYSPMQYAPDPQYGMQPAVNYYYPYYPQQVQQ